MRASHGARWRARGDRSPRAPQRQPFRALYIRERAPRAPAFGFHCSWVSLSIARLSQDACGSLCASLSRLSLSLPALCVSLGVSLSWRLSLSRVSHSLRLSPSLSLSLPSVSSRHLRPSPSLLASASARSSLGFNYI